jgi:hypothetical protein
VSSLAGFYAAAFTLVVWLASSWWVSRATDVEAGLRRVCWTVAIPVVGLGVGGVVAHVGGWPLMVGLAALGLLAGAAWASIAG